MLSTDPIERDRGQAGIEHRVDDEDLGTLQAECVRPPAVRGHGDVDGDTREVHRDDLDVGGGVDHVNDGAPAIRDVGEDSNRGRAPSASASRSRSASDRHSGRRRRGCHARAAGRHVTSQWRTSPAAQVSGFCVHCPHADALTEWPYRRARLAIVGAVGRTGRRTRGRLPRCRGARRVRAVLDVGVGLGVGDRCRLPRWRRRAALGVGMTAAATSATCRCQPEHDGSAERRDEPDRSLHVLAHRPSGFIVQPVHAGSFRSTIGSTDAAGSEHRVARRPHPAARPSVAEVDELQRQVEVLLLEQLDDASAGRRASCR